MGDRDRRRREGVGQGMGGTVPQAGLLDHVLRRLRTQEFLGQLWGPTMGRSASVGNVSGWRRWRGPIRA